MKKIKELVLENTYFSWLQFFSNWLMQGIFHADRSERRYKILFSLFFGLIFTSLFLFGMSLKISSSFLLGFISAHTLNWIVNNNLFVLIVHRIKWVKTDKKTLFDHLYSMQERLNKIDDNDWLLYSVSLGGICNGTLNVHSDIDVSLIRKPGFINMLKAIKFYVMEKKIADFNGVPLDIFICDSAENCIIRSKNQKNPIVLSNQNMMLDQYYPDNLSISIKEAMVLNNFKS